MSSYHDLKDRVFRKSKDALSREIAGETIVVPIRGRLADMQGIFALNEAAAFVWGGIDGKRPLAAVRDGILERFSVPPATAERDLAEFVGKLLEAGLIAG